MADAGPTSFLVVEELFAAGSPQFLPALRTFVDPAPMAAFAEKWLRDPRPWAREQMLAYIDLPLNAGNHNSLVKRLFKGAEARQDDLLLSAWAVSFDRLVRRVRRKRWRWDYTSRMSVPEERLISPEDRLHYFPGHRYREPGSGQWIVYGQLGWRGRRLFSHHTRHYLRRRAWRYFRHLGHRRPTDYVPAVAAMIGSYTDADLATGDNLMDCWSLLHACFGESESIAFTTHRTKLVGGPSLANLAAAPAFGALWQNSAAAPQLLSLLTAARSTFARVWSIDLLRRWHAEALVGLPVEQVAPLLAHPDEAVWSIGIELFEKASGLESLPFDRWFRLLQNRNLTVLDAVARLMMRHVTPASVSLFDAINLAKTEAAPVARLGLNFLQGRSIDPSQLRQALVHLADARCAAVGYDIGTWALGHLGVAGVYNVDTVTRFFDSLLPEIRAAARDWLASATKPSAGWHDPALWSRLVESPFEDIRLFLVDVLQQRQNLPGATDDAITFLWTGVLLNIHRGGRRKLTALRQISDAIRQTPARAEMLIPVLAAAIRSVRVPETRAGLSAIVGAVAARPELADTVRRQLPELDLSPTPIEA
ncbi:hypothetical protein [Humisphaera borealis]|uniref:Uncharacterized protein n=1 Tax=Humisphaera borealis TaxID=2807512 RepID=A0A7M2WPG5_9BACT|nr:hypothetical protein [Humisphaera borealis]QOV87415.1 hypothetical protein IPV69_14055 [Humisphaera borealis]